MAFFVGCFRASIIHPQKSPLIDNNLQPHQVTYAHETTKPHPLDFRRLGLWISRAMRYSLFSGLLKMIRP
jgi:hypothetical protein